MKASQYPMGSCSAWLAKSQEIIALKQSVMLMCKDECKLALLRRLKRQELTFSKASTEIKQVKQLQPVQDTFIRETGVVTWSGVEETFPEYTSRKS